MQSIDLVRIAALGILLAGFFPTGLCAAQSSGDEELTRGAFLKTRVKNTIRKTGSSPKSTTGPKAEQPPKVQPAAESEGGKSSDPNSGGDGGSEAVPIGLGYTLFKKGAGDKPVRVPATQVFRTGDEVRLAIEPNISGYLYVFYTDAAGQANMLFPNAQLKQGDNFVKSHVLHEVPSSQDSPSWFSFDDRPATQRLYLVISREPLPEVPIGEKLLASCPDPKDCLWKPADGIWSQIMAGVNAPKKTGKSRIDIQAQTEGEHTAITRGLGLSAKDPSPTLIQMNVSADAPMLVMVADLIQK